MSLPQVDPAGHQTRNRSLIMSLRRSSSAIPPLVVSALALLFLSCESGTEPGAQVHMIIVSPAQEILPVGAELLLHASALTEDGQILDQEMTWTSSDPAVAEVDPSGLVTAVAPDDAPVTITASSDGKKGTAVIAVFAPVESLVLSPAEASLRIGSTLQIEALLKDAEGNTLDDREVTWTSSNPDGIQVSATGLATALAIHDESVTITASSGEGHGASLITVIAPVQAVDVAPAVASVAVGDTLRLSATPLAADGSALEDREITWSTSDAAAATIDSSGLLIALAHRDVAISVTAVSEGTEGTASISILAGVESVEVAPAEAILAPADTVRLEAVPRDAEGRALKRFVAWTSSDAEVATVDSTGLVMAIADGSASVTATTGGRSDSTLIRVVSPVASIVLTPDTLWLLEDGSTELTVTLHAEDGTVLGDRAIEWTTSDSTTATVDGGGTVRAVTTGFASITATSEGVGASAVVGVDTVRQMGESPQCGLTPSGEAYCWGPNDGGEVGDGTTERRTTPTPVAGDLVFSEISGKICNTVALAPDGTAYAWGNNFYGSLGIGEMGERHTPTPVVGGLTFRTVSAMCNNTIALGTDGEIYQWGSIPGSGGRVALAPELLTSPVPFIAISNGGPFALALTADGDVYSWGTNVDGALGLGIVDDPSNRHVEPTPVPVPALAGHDVAVIMTAFEKGFALTSAGQLFAWGDNSGGGLGDGTLTSRTAPAPTAGILRFKSIAGDDSAIHGITVSGQLYAWGVNNVGQLGTGDKQYHQTPVLLHGMPPFYSIESGVNSMHATTADGIRYSWGYNGSGGADGSEGPWGGGGQLGVGDLIDRYVPTPLAGGLIFVP